MSTYRERRTARAERLRGWAEKREARTDSLFASAREAIAGIPFGQPILIGHHSEKRHRRDLDRHDQRMRAAIDNQATAARMESKADEIERQADGAIYSDDPDAIEALTAKIATLEAQRAAMKAANVAFRKGDAAFAAQQGITLEQAAARRALINEGYSWCRQPFPAYSLQNLGGTITRARQRLAGLVKAATPPAAADRPRHPGETATARAGLTVIEGLTTPSRPGKRPRTVYTVTGTGNALSYWRLLLVKLGGKPYGNGISFWDDPTAEVEAALLADEGGL